MKELIKTINGIEIYVIDGGKFTATLNGHGVTRSSIVAIEKVIGKSLSPVKVFEVSYDSSVKEDSVIDIQSSQYGRETYRMADRRLDKYNSYYVWDDDLVQKLNELSKRRAAADKAFDKELGALMKKAKLLTAKVLREIRKPTATATNEDRNQGTEA